MRFSRYIVGKIIFILPNGDGEIRTLDPLLARQVLSQLSYTPSWYLFNYYRLFPDDWAYVDSNHRPHAYQACALTG